MISAPPSSPAARLATACAVGLVLSTVGAFAALTAESEEEAEIVVFALILLVGIPLLLWTGFVVALVAGRGRRALAAGMITGVGVGAFGVLAASARWRTPRPPGACCRSSASRSSAPAST